ncbi:MAG: hypothetical protein PF518_18990 [Spirochaetaceae bacterium]|jgi:hypothetical protein|nr:hypothetical protein [Spirochaetaceae bacterium]
MKYTFLAIDEGKKTLLKADTDRKTILWKSDLSDYPQSRDMQKLDNDSVLIGYENGYFICASETGEILHDCRKWSNITSALRLSDGKTLITGLNLEGIQGVCLLKLDKDDQILELRNRPGDYVRLMRPGLSDSFLFCANDHITETDNQLHEIRRFESDGFLHAWKPMILPDKTILISAGYGAFMARFSCDGKEIQTFGRKDDIPEEIEPFFYGGFDVTADGNILVPNWQGHGPHNGAKGQQLICFSPEGKYLDSWSFPSEISSFQGVLLLDEQK